MASKPKDEFGDYDPLKLVYDQFLQDVGSRMQEGRVYCISELKVKLKEVLESSGFALVRSSMKGMKRNLGYRFGKTLGKYVSSGKSFYYLKGVTSPGAVIAQV